MDRKRAILAQGQNDTFAFPDPPAARKAGPLARSFSSFVAFCHGCLAMAKVSENGVIRSVGSYGA